MLKAASLPPSMKKREKTRPKYSVCPRTYRDLDTNDGRHALKNGKRANNSEIENEFDELRNEFINSGHRSSKASTSKRERKVSTDNPINIFSVVMQYFLEILQERLLS